jgi:parallel beta-helix repeat protein
VFGNIARDNGDGFAVHGSHENTLRYNTSLSNDHGFTVQESSSHNVFTNNVANLNTFNGFLIGESVANTLSMNVANVNKASGVAIFESDNNLVSRTVANSNADFGFVVFGGSSNNKVEYSVARGNGNFDAWDEGTGVGNIWNANHFGTTTGLPTSP